MYFPFALCWGVSIGHRGFDRMLTFFLLWCIQHDISSLTRWSLKNCSCFWLLPLPLYMVVWYGTLTVCIRSAWGIRSWAMDSPLLTTGLDPESIPQRSTSLAMRGSDLISMTTGTTLQQWSTCSVVVSARKGRMGDTIQKQGKALEGVSITRVGVTLIGFTVSLQSLAIFLPAA